MTYNVSVCSNMCVYLLTGGTQVNNEQTYKIWMLLKGIFHFRQAMSRLAGHSCLHESGN